jgi:serine phosphatase RsbU (regulator of sigma subunit)
LWKLHPEYLFNNKQSVALSTVMFAAITYWLARISWFVEEASKKSTRTLVVTRKQKRELDRISKELRLKDKSLARDLNFARNFQLNQLPDLEIFNTGGFKSAMHYIALDTVGGDIIDMVRFSPDRIGVFVGDVSGHGVRAAMVAMMARVGFANLCKMSDDPAIVAAALNAFLCRSLENDRSCYMTAIYVIIDRSTMQMHLTCAGHTPAILIRTNHTIEEIDTHPSLFLGVEPDQGYKTTTVSVQPSDKLLLYTDGLTEPLNDAGEQYGERVFGEFLRSRAGLEPSEILAGLAVSMEGFTTENLRDDVAIVCVKVE